MNRLIIYFTIYILLISVVGLYFDKFNISGIDITKSRFIVVSLIIPFLILMQWSFETLFNIELTTRKSIVGKVLGIIIGLAITFVVLFFMLKFVVSFLITRTILLIIAALITIGILLSIPSTREILLNSFNYVKVFIKKSQEHMQLLINRAKNSELSITQKLTYGTISILAILIIVLREYDTIIRNILLPKHKTLLNKPIYLQKEQNIGSTENINMKHISTQERRKNKSLREDIKLDLNYNYALSAFVYLNPQGQNTRVSYGKFTKLLDFGENPTVYFNSKTNQLKLEFYVEDNIKKEIRIHLNETKPLFYQKWNSLIFNVKGGDIDVFLNGKLIHHQQLTSKYKIEAITTGEDKGINGGIKDIMFFNTPLKLYQIHLLSYITL